MAEEGNWCFEGMLLWGVVRVVVAVVIVVVVVLLFVLVLVVLAVPVVLVALVGLVGIRMGHINTKLSHDHRRIVSAST